MTCIVGLVDSEGRVWMGGDSATTSEYGFLYQNNYRKIVHNGDFLIGTSGSARVGQLMKHVLEPPPCDGQPHQYMVKDFARAVRECIEKEDAKEQFKDSQLLIGYRQRLFYIGPNYMVSESQDGYFAIGCGQEIALGVLHALSIFARDILPAKRVEMALEASEKFNAYVRHPFLIESI